MKIMLIFKLKSDVKKLTTISKTKFKDLMNLINEYEEELIKE